MKKLFAITILLASAIWSIYAYAGEVNLGNLTYDASTKTLGIRTEASTPIFVKYQYGIAHIDAGSLAAGASVDVTVPVLTAGAAITDPDQVEIVSVSTVATANSACKVKFYSRAARRGGAYNSDTYCGSANFNSLVADGSMWSEDSQGIIPYVNEDGNSQIEATVTNTGASPASYYFTILYRY